MTNHVRNVRVLSIPAEHPYPQAVRPQCVAYLPDPDINGHWWPHPALDATYWTHNQEVGLVHIHFGFEHRSPQEIRNLVAVLPVPLVLTVHDVDNPHLVTAQEQDEHHERLHILLDAADAVVTLTNCAAQRLRDEFGATDVHVIPHPAIIVNTANVPRENVAGVFLKSLRANVISDPQFYLRIASRVPLRVYVHETEATSDIRDALQAAGNGVELLVHPPLDDASLYREVASLTACLLPYTVGTHSGWLEMCRDLGTTVAVPDCGCYADQADTALAVETYKTGDSADAARSLLELLDRGAMPYGGNREQQLHWVRDAYGRIYDEVLQR